MVQIGHPYYLGHLSLIVAIFIVSKFTGWWVYIVGSFLLMMALGSLKTGFFASDNEITELTEPGTVSEETKRGISG